MLSLSDMVTYGARSALPGGLGLPASVIWSARQIATMRYGVDWSAVDYLDNSSWLRVPTLLIHGAADPVSPLTVSQRRRDAKPQRVTLEVFPKALHAES
jgi:uncharacterized protein